MPLKNNINVDMLSLCPTLHLTAIQVDFPSPTGCHRISKVPTGGKSLLNSLVNDDLPGNFARISKQGFFFPL